MAVCALAVGTALLGLAGLVFAVGFCTRRARHGCAIKKASKPETSTLSVLDPVLHSLAPVEFQHGTLERKFALRRVRMGPLVPQNLCYQSSISAGVVSFPYLARDSVSLLCLGISQAIRL